METTSNSDNAIKQSGTGCATGHVAANHENYIEEKSQEKCFKRSESLYSNWKQRPCSSSEMIRSKISQRFLFGPAPDNQLGPNACLTSSDNANGDDDCGMYQLVCPDPSLIQMKWHSPPTKVLIIKKIFEANVTRCFKELTSWIAKESKFMIFVEPSILTEDDVCMDEGFADTLCLLQGWDAESSSDSLIDFIICLGGDGTLLHAASLFQGSCPPVLAFHLGTLGFLTPHSFSGYRGVIDRVIENDGIHLTLRSRIKCQVLDTPVDIGDRINGIRSPQTVLSQYILLNDLVIDRGSSSGLAHLDIFCNGRHLTTLLGDGLIIATPTGSTAYSAAAGASMIHPDVPGIVLTAVCPHSLSFRPIVLPPGVELRVQVASPPHRAPQSAWASFDGRERQELTPGHCIRVTTSVYPVPCIGRQDHLNDWFDGLSRCLRWNARESHRKLTPVPSTHNSISNNTFL